VSGYPRSCEEVKQDLQKRHQPFIDNGWNPVPISKDDVLHRLVRAVDIDPSTQKPSKSVFSNHGLSVLVESATFPLDIRKCVEESDIFIGAVRLSVREIKEMGYEICLDPHPDPLGNLQHPNHAQIVCKKTQGNTKKMRDNCQWSVYPDSLSQKDIKGD
jgi:hypothetical protein